MLCGSQMSLLRSQLCPAHTQKSRRRAFSPIFFFFFQRPSLLLLLLLLFLTNLLSFHHMQKKLSLAHTKRNKKRFFFHDATPSSSSSPPPLSNFQKKGISISSFFLLPLAKFLFFFRRCGCCTSQFPVSPSHNRSEEREGHIIICFFLLSPFSTLHLHQRWRLAVQVHLRVHLRVYLRRRRRRRLPFLVAAFLFGRRRRCRRRSQLGRHSEAAEV